jgi:hypothetical protein
VATATKRHEDVFRATLAKRLDDKRTEEAGAAGD